MAKGIQNEIAYAKYFEKYYDGKKYPQGITVRFVDEKNARNYIELPKVTELERVGQDLLKADLVVTTNKRLYRISIKDNRSIYWGSEDTYIRKTRGDEIRAKIKALADDATYVVYDEKLRKYVLRTPLAIEIDDRAKNKTLFGSERKMVSTSNATVDVVIRGEIDDKSVTFTNGVLYFKVKKIYRTIHDIDKHEEPLLFIYSAAGRITFNENVEPGAKFTEQFTGIRGQYRSRENVEKTLARTGGIIIF